MILRPLLTSVFVLFLATISMGQEASPSDAPPQEPSIHTVKPAPFKIEVKLSGVFESTSTQAVKVDTDQIASLVIQKVLPHGSKVRKGQPIIWFETKAADRQLRDAEANLRLAELAFQEKELDKRQQAETQKLNQAIVERTQRNARQDFDYFMRVDRGQREKSVAFSLKSSRSSLENAMEELKQLEKMYKEDELTEESEEIVLKRAKQSVENAKRRLETSELQAKQTLARSIPRDVESRQDAIARQQLAYDKAKRTAQIARERGAIQFEQEKQKLDKQRQDLKELRADRQKLVLDAPMDGILYYGKIDYGSVSDTRKTPTVRLEAGKTVAKNQLLATIANPQALQVRINLEEKSLRHVTAGTSGSVTPTAYPDRSLPSKVKSISHVPHAPNKFDSVVTLKLQNNDPPIMPAMTCSVALLAYQKNDALAVPSAAVHQDAKKRHYVNLHVKGKEPKRQIVKVGKQSGGKTEIVSGLKAGDKVVLPKSEK